MNRLIAVVGLPGSGKTEAIRTFEEAGFTKVYFGAVTLEKVKEQGLEVNEVNERKVREQLRAEMGMAAYAILNIPKITELLKKSDVVIESMYSWEEYTMLKEKFPQFQVVAVYSPPQLRYKRLSTRPVRPLTPEEAKSRDYSQIENAHQAGPIAMADHTVINTGSMEDLAQQLRKIIDNG